MADHDPALSRLLAGRRTLSRPEKENIFEAVYSGVGEQRAPAQHSRGRSWFGIALAFAVAAGLMATVGLFAPPSNDDAAFGVRGTASGPMVTLLCEGSPQEATCDNGQSLGFEVAGATAWSHVALFARRPDGAVIWYVPADETGTSTALERGVQTALVPFSVELGQDHPPGQYEVTAVFSGRPLDREEIKRRVRLPGDDVRLVEQELTVR